VAVASAEPYASLHLAPDRKPCQYPTTLFFTGRMPFLPPNQQRQSTEGTALKYKFKKKDNKYINKYIDKYELKKVDIRLRSTAADHQASQAASAAHKAPGILTIGNVTDIVIILK